MICKVGFDPLKFTSPLQSRQLSYRIIPSIWEDGAQNIGIKLTDRLPTEGGFCFLGRGTMKRLGTVILVLAGFIGGIAFVYSCGGGSSSQSGNLTWPSPVAATGQITSYAGSDDGALQTGVAWPDPRFTDNVDGTVTDNLTGLVWLKNANCFVQTNWTSAIIDANQLASGSCSLSDGSAAGDWRLPNRSGMS